MITRFKYALSLLKIWRDAWQDKVRSSIVIATIVISVFMLGTIYITWVVLSTELGRGYNSVNPAHAVLITRQRFNEDIVSSIRNMPEVAQAEGRAFETMRMHTGDGNWRFIQLFALADYQNMTLDKITRDLGDLPPPTQTVLIERATLPWLFPNQPPHTLPTQSLIVRLPSDKDKMLQISGQIHDLVHPPSSLADTAYGYITLDTLSKLTNVTDYNMLLFTIAGNPTDVAEVQVVSDLVRTRLNRQGIYLERKELRQPNQHPLNNIIQTILFIIGALGVLGLVLSAVLILNTISTLQASQVKQVGIMKTIGASPLNIALISLTVIFIFGLVAVIIAIPLCIVGAWGLTTFAATLMNLEIGAFRVPPESYGLEVAIGLFFPLFIALFPILRGSRITVREAISDADASQPQFGKGGFDRLLNVQFLPIFFRYALRNMFRHKVRSAFVILVLSVAGAIFITTLSLRSSLFLTIDSIVAYWQQDVRVLLRQPYRLARVEQVAATLPDVGLLEGRLSVDAFAFNANGKESKRIITVIGLPPTSQFIQPTLLAGRWLQPDDQQAIVVNVGVIQDSSSPLAVGDTLTLRINGRETDWHVVGLVTSQVIGNADFLSSVAYTPYADLAKAMGQTGRINELLVGANPQTTKTTPEIITALEGAYNAAGVRTFQIHGYFPMRRALNSLFAIPVSLTFLMTILFAGVGGLGLMGMMSLNVMQRTREIAVVRTLGSTDPMVAGLIISEGLVIGLFSWVLGIIIAIPLSRFLSATVGLAFLNARLTYSFPLLSILLCFFFILFLAIIASFIPARTAAQLSIRDALNYE